ncbi:aromatic motif membrane protein [Mycoplasmopsis meleagridis]|uniref:aromatic motif membrane protein n=1 Tax=Mycoplasmopsis meleagridis TaxID=29561 RepID=UPI003A88F1C9
MKFKKILLSTPLISLISLSTFSCANYQNSQELEKYIDHKFDIAANISNNEKIQSDEIKEKLLDLVFKNDEVKKIEFLNSQKQDSIIEEKFKNALKIINPFLKQKENIIKEIGKLNDDLKKYLFLQAKFQNEIMETNKLIQEKNNELKLIQGEFEKYAQEISLLISQNWYWFFNNLEKFNFSSYKYISSDLLKKVVDKEGNILTDFQNIVTNSYINKVNSLEPAKDFSLTTNYLSSLVYGEESAELGDSAAYYLLVDKIVFRIIINKINSENSSLEIEPLIWYFENLKAPTISLKFISSIYHYAFIHSYSSGYKQFIDDMVVKQRYGEPSAILPIIKEKNEI